MAFLIPRTALISAALVSASLAHLAYTRVGADPTDDFSFVFALSEGGDRFALMNEGEIAEIFRDRLEAYPKGESGRLARHLLELCRKFRFDPAFILSMIDVESGFRATVVSPAGAIGLMQLMPATAEQVARRGGMRFPGGSALKDPFTNLALGIAYLFQLRERYRGHSPYFHVAAYNIGPARLDELRKNEGFKPVNTKAYYEKIRRGVPKLRFHRIKELV